MLMWVKIERRIKLVEQTKFELGGIVVSETHEQKNEPRGIPFKNLNPVGDTSKPRGH